MFVISVINQKGGVGKTTTADALAAYLSKEPINGRVLAVDMDSQCNLTVSYGLNPYETRPSIRDVLLGLPIKEAIQESGRAPIIAGDLFMSTIDTKLSGNDKYKRLKKCLKSLESRFDFVVIDAPPGVNTSTLSSLIAADLVIVPAVADVFSLQGIQELFQSVEAVKKEANKGIKIGGVLFTNHNPRVNITQAAAEQIKAVAEANGVVVLDAYIRKCAVLQEVPLVHQNIFDYAPKSNAAKDYKQAFDEMFERLNEKGEE